MESSRNLKLFAGEITFFTGGLCQDYLLSGAGKYRLVRGVTVGNYQLQLLLGKQPFHLGKLCRYRQHGSFITIATVHTLATQTGEPMEGLFIQGTGGTEGGQFTIAVPGSPFPLQAELPQKL